MKRFLVFSMIATAFLLSFSATAAAQDLPDDDEEVIPIVPGESNQNNGQGRGIYQVPICVSLFRTISYIRIDFTAQIGNVTFSMTNLTNNSSTEMVIDSSFGDFYFPITLGSGNYRISFVAQGGASYEGYFSVN